MFNLSMNSIIIMCQVMGNKQSIALIPDSFGVGPGV